MDKIRNISKEKLYSWLIGIGLIILVIHQPNQPLVETRVLFLPILGMVMILFCSIDYFISLRASGKLDLGSKWIWIPMLIIVSSIVIRPIYTLITGDGVVIDGQDKGLIFEAISIMIIIGMFTLYITSRKLGNEIFRIMPTAVIIVTISCIYGFFSQNGTNGGLISPTNYDMATGFLIFGTLVSPVEKRWWLLPIATIGIFFTGALEGVFILGILSLVVLIRKDFGKKMIPVLCSLAIIVIIGLVLGLSDKLQVPRLTGEVAGAEIYFNRGYGYTYAMNNLSLLGNGFNINHFYREIPHNVPLIIIHQIGIVGAIAWCISTIYLIIKTKWRYAWIGFIAMGVFDHYTWTMACAWYWALAGVSSSSNIKEDFVFKLE